MRSGQTMSSTDVDPSEPPQPEITTEHVEPPARSRTKRRASTRADSGELESAGESASTEVPCADLPLGARIEALLMSADRPMAEGKLANLLGLTGKGTMASIRDAVDALNSQYAQAGRCFAIEKLAGGYQILTRTEFASLVSQFHREREDSRLSNAALETLAIVAYRQPILRAQIEAIRGVAAGEVLRGLLERRLVKIVGRAEELGRPMLYGTTSEFLRVFGLAGLDDLPEVDGLKREPAAQPQDAASMPLRIESPRAAAPDPSATPPTPDAPETFAPESSGLPAPASPGG